MEKWTKELSNNNHQIVCVVENGLIKRHIYNQPTNEKTIQDAKIIAAAPTLLSLLNQMLRAKDIEHLDHICSSAYEELKKLDLLK